MHTDRCSVGLGQSGVLQAPPWAAPAVLLRVLRSRVAVFRGLCGGVKGANGWKTWPRCWGNEMIWMSFYGGNQGLQGVSPLKIYYILLFFFPYVPLQVRCDLLYIFVPYEVKTEYLKTRWSRVGNDQRPCFPESEIGSHFTPRISK